ncbi:MAG TPA: hypothetical protein PLK80_14460, partial [bacterium]|nr:hypothetical protein [bacterium]
TIDDNGRCVRDNIDTAGDCVYRIVTSNHKKAPMRVTLVWTDPPCPSASNCDTKALINNLNLEVRKGSRTYYGNAGLTGFPTGAFELKDGANRDVRNNVEQVATDSDGDESEYYITVKWHDNPPAGRSQSFAVVAYNGNEELRRSRKMKGVWDLLSVPLRGFSNVLVHRPKNESQSWDDAYYFLASDNNGNHHIRPNYFADGENLTEITDTTDDIFEPGRAFHFRSYKGDSSTWEQYYINFTGTPVQEDEVITLDLTPGWNLIGNPYEKNIPWDDRIEITCNGGGSYMNLGAAVSAGRVNRTLAEIVDREDNLSTPVNYLPYPPIVNAGFADKPKMEAWKVYALYIDNADGQCGSPGVRFTRPGMNPDYFVRVADNIPEITRPTPMLHLTASNMPRGSTVCHAGLIDNQNPAHLNARRPPDQPVSNINISIRDNNIDYGIHFKSKAAQTEYVWDVRITLDPAGSINNSTVITLDSVPALWKVELRDTNDTTLHRFTADDLDYEIPVEQAAAINDFKLALINEVDYTPSAPLALDGVLQSGAPVKDYSGINLKFYRNDGTQIGEATTDSGGSFTATTVGQAAQVDLEFNNRVVETLDLTSAANNIDFIGLMGACDTDNPGVACLRGGNAEDAPEDRRKFS